MDSLASFVCVHPYFSMLVFTAIGFLLRGMKRLDLQAIKINIKELETALDEGDIDRAKNRLQQLKSGFGFQN